MGRVIVYILSQQANSARAERLAALFTDPMFQVEALVSSCSISDQVREALKLAHDHHSHCRVLIIRDTSVTTATAHTVAEVVKAAESDFDLCYLCRWLDQCQLYTNKRPVPGHLMHFFEAQQPQGLQALLFSVPGRDIALGLRPGRNDTYVPLKSDLDTQLTQEVLTGNIRAQVVSPNLFEFDLRLVDSNEDYIKLSSCVPLSSAQSSCSSTSGAVWVFALAIVALLLVWAAVKLGAK